MKMEYSNPRKPSMKYRKNRTYYPFNPTNKSGFTFKYIFIKCKKPNTLNVRIIGFVISIQAN